MSRKTILATYSPEDVTISLAGMIPVEGYTEGTFVSISKDTPYFTTKESSDGFVSRVAHRSNLYTVQLTLMGTSESNKILTKLAVIDNNTHIVKFPFIVKDTLGSTLLFSTSSWIETSPATDYSVSVDSRIWTIKCANASLTVGGNEQESGLMQDAISTIAGLAPSLRTLF